MVGYYHQPTLSHTSVAFVCEDDVWVLLLLPTLGSPYRITTDGCSRRPSLSPDGKWVAYTSYVTGAEEVFVVSAEGGRPLQLTHFGADSLVVGWTPDGNEVAFTSNYRQARNK